MNKSDIFRINLRFLRSNAGLQQSQMAVNTGVSSATWSDYERGKSEPKFEALKCISEFFQVPIDALLKVDLRQNVHLIGKSLGETKSKNVHLNVHPIVHLIGQNSPIKAELEKGNSGNFDATRSIIPITDISVAAGAGEYNGEYIEQVDSLQLPSSLVKTGHTYLCVKIRGTSMAPTLQDGGYVIIRLLDKGEWAKMPDERVFVVVDKEGKSYLKRVKNRFKKGFIVLRSDSPDQASFPSFNITESEVQSIWYVEWYFSAKMPNIHDQFYSRLQRLEDKFDNYLKDRT